MRKYDNWERLVVAVLQRQHDREIALCPSMNSSTLSSRSSSFSSDYSTSGSFSLISDYQVTINGSSSSTTIFCHETKSGKKCYLMGARELGITWGADTRYWEWTPHPDSRFEQVAQLKDVCWLDIRGTINTRMLSPKTTYGAYLVFKLAETCYGLQSANTVVRFVKAESARKSERRAGVVHPQGGGSRNGRVAVRRSDGWMEIEVGSFYSGRGDKGEVEARVMEIQRLHWKSGLIVEGIDFRPQA